MKHIIISFLIALIILYGAFKYDPVILNKEEIPQEYIEAIESQSEGVYSNRLPLLPLFVYIDGYVDDRVYYTIHYFPYGSVGMSYKEDDGYNIEKNFSPLQ
ncbi:MAG: hypothetical protein E7191_03185 [Erysipelotrichaceae bacterium]|nr:hypothetical protein [Erysipelotrichaceae bacterium]MBR3694242.1 hypothetical protein [Erysipelotrichales bacterium]